MLSAKRSEDARLAESYGLHRSVLDTINQEHSALYYPHRLPTLSPALHNPSGEPTNKRRSPSHSPPHRFSPYTRSPPTPPSSDSSDPSFSPKSNSMPIANLLCGSKQTSSPRPLVQEGRWSTYRYIFLWAFLDVSWDTGRLIHLRYASVTHTYNIIILYCFFLEYCLMHLAFFSSCRRVCITHQSTVVPVLSLEALRLTRLRIRVSDFHGGAGILWLLWDRKRLGKDVL